MTAYERIRLKRLFASSVGGSWGSPPEEESTAVPCVRGTDLDFQRLRVNVESAPIRSYPAAEVRYRGATAGDIIIEKSGGGENQPVGRVGLYDGRTIVMPTNFAGRLRPSSGQDARYLTYLLASLYFDGKTRAAIKQTTGIQNLEVEALLSSEVPRLSQEEQRAIADYLDTETARIDALITKKRRMIELLEERATAMRDAWHDRLALRHGTVSIRRLVSSIEQGWSPVCDGVAAEPQEWGVLKTSAVSSGQFVPTKNKRLPLGADPDLRWAVRDGDLLATRGSGSPSMVGRACVARTRGRQLTISDLIYRLRLHSCVPDYVAAALASSAARFQIESSIRTDVGQTLKIRGEDLANLRVPEVPASQQSDSVRPLVRQLGQVASAQTRLARQVDLLIEHRQALITAAVTGELDVSKAA